MLSRLSVCLLAIALVGLGTERLMADWRDDIGWTQLLTEIGPGLERGEGIVVSMVEAPGSQPTLYLPSAASAQFTGKTIIDGTGTSTGSTGHATSVATVFFGNTGSMANGITNITGYEANDWINNKMGFASGADPVVQNFQVQNHSYIGGGDNDAARINLMQRIDYVVNRDDITIVAGTSNGGNIPDFLVHAYNVISVGQSSGSHGSGLTRFYGAGRVKPDIVAPFPNSSTATPAVSSAAAILHQRGAGTDATRSQTIRSILMAGATKEEFVDWDRTSTRPLDEVYGAGELNIYNSYKILEGGQFEGSLIEPVTAIGDHGWDYQSSIDPTESIFYGIEIAEGGKWLDFSIMLNWNMEITDTNPDPGIFAPTQLLANMDLELFDSSNSFLGSLLDSSVSTIGNVEHIYLNSLSAGTYTLRVTSDIDSAFAISWRATAIPEPSLSIIIALIVLGLVCMGRSRTAGANVPVRIRRR